MPRSTSLAPKFMLVVARPRSEQGSGRFGQMFGVTAENADEGRRLVSERLTGESDAFLLSIRSTWDPDWESRDADIEERIAPVEEKGIWYMSGRAWFDEGDEEILDDLI